MRILIADDHSIVRKGLRQILQEGLADAEIQEVPDAESMINEVIRNDWDVIISDLSMPKRSGLDALPQIKEINAKIPVLILSIHPEDQYALRVLRAGAAGYLSKDLAPDELVDAVKTVVTGKKYISSAVAEKLAGAINKKSAQTPHESLSDREFTVLKLLASGKSITDISEQLMLSITTVSTYRTRILAKMNLKNNAELTIYCLENNLL